MTDNILQKDSCFVAVIKEFNDTEIHGIFFVREEFNIELIKEEWSSVNPNSNSARGYDFSIKKFIDWMTKKELITPIPNSFEWCIDSNDINNSSYLEEI